MTDLIPRDAVRNEVARLGKEFLDGGSPTAANVLNLAADRINTITAIDPAAIREAALREAAEICSILSTKAYDQGRGDYIAHGIDAAAILALIGEKK